jgi:cytosine/adenosine deaminase-related metal-dependent hydrolase
MRIWLRDPLAILAADAPLGLVIEGGRIVELVGKAGPTAPCDSVFDASRHVVIPGLINTHHHFFQTLTQKHDVIISDCERVLAKYHDASPGSFCTIALAPCAPFNVTKELMLDTAALAAQSDCRLHTHLGETVEENDYCEHHFHCRPLDYLEQLGWLTDRVWLAHGVHFNDDEVKRLGRHRVGVCHCPTSNMVLASGMCRTRDLEAAGATVGLGVDGSASNDSSNIRGVPAIVVCPSHTEATDEARKQLDGLDLEIWDGAPLVTRIKSLVAS